MTNQLRVINASASEEPLYVFVTPNPAWQIADGLVGLATLLIPTDELAALAKEAMAAVKAADAEESSGFLSDMSKVVDDVIDYLQSSWVGTATTAVYVKVEKAATSIYEVYKKFSQLLNMKTALMGMYDTVGGKAEIEQTQKRLDGIIAAFEQFFADHAYKVLPLEIQGWDEISKNPLDYLAPSGWAALANADTAHLTVYRKGRFLADFNAHSQSAYVCTDEVVWRIDGDDWADRVETIHGITPVNVSDKARQDVECFFKSDLNLVGDAAEGYKPQEILRIAVKPEYRVLPQNLRVDVKWNDQGSGNQKGYLVLALMRDGQPVKGPQGDIATGSGFAPHAQATAKIECAPDSEFVNAMKPGDELVVSAVVGAGGGHELHVKSLLVTFGTSTLVYQGPPFEKEIPPDMPPVRNLYHTFPFVTHPHAAIPGRQKWVPKIKSANIAVYWDASTLLNEYEMKKVLAGEDIGDFTVEEELYKNDSINTAMEVWKNGAKVLQENLWTKAPDPNGLSGPDLWLGDISDTLLQATQLPQQSDPVPVEWAISIWYEPDNIYPIFRRKTHLQILTFVVFVQYEWFPGR